MTKKIPVRIFTGTVVTTVDSSSTADGYEALLFSDASFRNNFGWSFDVGRGDFVGVMNSDYNNTTCYIRNAAYYNSKNIWVGFNDMPNGYPIRFNYLVALVD